MQVRDKAPALSVFVGTLSVFSCKGFAKVQTLYPDGIELHDGFQQCGSSL